MLLKCEVCRKNTTHYRFQSDKRAASPQNQVYCSECLTVQEVKPPKKVGWFSYDEEPKTGANS